MRASFETGTGRLIEAQSDADDETLLGNAERQGYAREAVTVRDLGAGDLAALLASAPARRVRKSVITARVTTAGKIDAAMQTLMSRPALFARWVAPDRGEVNADDPETVAFLNALGLDPAAILAPDADA